MAAHYEQQGHHDYHFDHVDDFVVAYALRDVDHERKVSVEDID